MAKYTLADRVAALKFAREVEAAALQAPNAYTKRAVRQAANQIIRTFGFSDDDKKRMVRHWIGQGCSNFHDLAEETGLEKSDLESIVAGLVEDGAAVLTKIAALGENGAGRPGWFIALIEESRAAAAGLS